MFSTQLTLNTNLSIRCNKTSSIVFDHTWINSLIIKSGFSDLLNSILYKSVIIKICLNCIKIYVFKLDIFKIDTTFQSSSSIKMCQKYLFFIQINEDIKAPNFQKWPHTVCGLCSKRAGNRNRYFYEDPIVLILSGLGAGRDDTNLFCTLPMGSRSLNCLNFLLVFWNIVSKTEYKKIVAWYNYFILN